MDWAAPKEALAAEFDTTADRQKAVRRLKTARMAPGCVTTVFVGSLQQSFDRALPGLDGVPHHQLLSDQFVEGVQPALGAQLRLARATGQLSVEELAGELAEAPLATLQSQETRDSSPVDELQTRVDQHAEQPAAGKTESRRHARTSRALTQDTIQAVIEINGERELCLIDTRAGVSLRRRGNQAERRPCVLAVRAVCEYRLRFDGLSIHSIRLGNKSVQHTFLISPDIEQTILGADFLKSTGSVIDLKQEKLVTSYGAVKLEGYPGIAVDNLHVLKPPSCNVPSVQSVVKEYSELFTDDEDPSDFCPWIEHEIPLSSERFRLYGPRCTGAGILPSCPSLNRGSREAEVKFEPRTFRSVNSCSKQLGPSRPRAKSTDDDDQQSEAGHQPAKDGTMSLANKLSHRTIKEWLAAKGGDWKVDLPMVLIAHCASMQQTTGKSPFMLMYGRHPPLPVGAKVKWKDHQNPGRSGLGSRKLDSRWQGPFVVPNRRENVYTIQDGRRSKRVNGAQLRKWYDAPEERPNRPAAGADLTEIPPSRNHNSTRRIIKRQVRQYPCRPRSLVDTKGRRNGRCKECWKRSQAVPFDSFGWSSKTSCQRNNQGPKWLPDMQQCRAFGPLGTVLRAAIQLATCYLHSRILASNRKVAREYEAVFSLRSVQVYSPTQASWCCWS
ncbi:gap-Pol polyprotein [Clonorchis sinensis]|uniref:Gap-Pol polyprotein n=1 Tax=Clonorchis sinensis TaxID=79923 RepID=G7YTF9_CLOSI|nr:gap-Pol polyprotein [Clonorchis sinensis]